MEPARVQDWLRPRTTRPARRLRNRSPQRLLMATPLACRPLACRSVFAAWQFLPESESQVRATQLRTQLSGLQDRLAEPQGLQRPARPMRAIHTTTETSAAIPRKARRRRGSRRKPGLPGTAGQKWCVSILNAFPPTQFKCAAAFRNWNDSPARPGVRAASTGHCRLPTSALPISIAPTLRVRTDGAR